MSSTVTTELGRTRRRRRLYLMAVVTAALGLSAVGASAAGTPVTSRGEAAHDITLYAFSVNGNSGGFVAAAGTDPNALSPGDEQIVNDQLTVTHVGKGGYPIIGHDAGTCTFSRIVTSVEGLASCVATAVLKSGSLTAQGVVEIAGGSARPGELAITGGTGKYAGARGTLRVGDARGHEIFTITLL
jgi:hypothetical protein